MHYLLALDVDAPPARLQRQVAQSRPSEGAVRAKRADLALDRGAGIVRTRIVVAWITDAIVDGARARSGGAGIGRAADASVLVRLTLERVVEALQQN